MAQSTNRNSNAGRATGDSLRAHLSDNSELPETGTVAPHDYQELPGAGIWRGLSDARPPSGAEAIKGFSTLQRINLNYP